MPETIDDAALASVRETWPDLLNARIERVNEGMSDALLYLVRDAEQPLRYIKVALSGAQPALRQEIARTAWLAAQGVRVPAVLRIDERPHRSMILTLALLGSPANRSPLSPRLTVEMLARAFAALHALDGASCPFDETLAVRLRRAAETVALGEPNPDQFEARNLDLNPKLLLERLVAQQPEEDLVVVHGDASLSNIILGPDGAVGFVDCGNAGRGDRYLDLGVLGQELSDLFGKECIPHFAKSYGRRGWDHAKAMFYADLYELF